MREYISKEEVIEIIRDIPSDLHEEYIYELDGIWIDEESEE